MACGNQNLDGVHKTYEKIGTADVSITFPSPVITPINQISTNEDAIVELNGQSEIWKLPIRTLLDFNGEN